MSSGKKKKPKSKPASGLPIIPMLIGMLIVFALMAGGYYVMGQRKTVSGYNDSVTKIQEALKTHNPESPGGPLKLAEIAPLVSGNPTVTRESKEGVDYAVYTWPGGISPVGFRLAIEKNGPIEEVAALKTFGAE